MLIQPAFTPATGVGSVNSVTARRLVSNGKLNVGGGGVEQGDGQGPGPIWLTPFSSSSKKLSWTVGSTSVQSPAGVPVRSVRAPEDARQTSNDEMTFGLLKYRAAHSKPSSSRWSP